MEKDIAASKKIKMNPAVKLSVLERVGYGIGDYSGNLIYSSISAFLLLYYTNVVGSSAKMAASVIAFSKILDEVSDLIMGIIVDRTHSKWGKARPWILRLCIPFAVASIFMFSVPSGLTGKAQYIYMFLTYNLVSTVFYTGINVPYATMNCLMTTNPHERGLLGNFRMLFATAGTLTVNTFVLKLVAEFGGGDQYNQAGWTKAYVIIGIATVALNLFMFAVCKERVVQTTQDQQKEVSFFAGIKALCQNKYWILMVICIFSMCFMMSCFYGSAVYFAQYNMEDVSYYTAITNAMSLTQIAIMFITPFIMKKIGKRNTMVMGTGILLAGFVVSAIGGTSNTVQVAASCLKGLGGGCGAAVMFGMLSDTIDYGEWKTGLYIAGMSNAASSFCMKIGSGIGTAALGWILAAGGFNGIAAEQSESALVAISFSFTWVPVITMVATLICLLFYKLDKEYPEIMKELNERHKQK